MYSWRVKDSDLAEAALHPCHVTGKERHALPTVYPLSPRPAASPPPAPPNPPPAGGVPLGAAGGAQGLGRGAALGDPAACWSADPVLREFQQCMQARISRT